MFEPDAARDPTVKTRGSSETEDQRREFALHMFQTHTPPTNIYHFDCPATFPITTRRRQRIIMVDPMAAWKICGTRRRTVAVGPEHAGV
eukprot:7945342-Pyramimonas_sp.AAC.1